MAIDYTAHLRADGERAIAGAARDLDAHVPTCPEWNVGKLITHLGLHHRWVAEAVRGGGKPPEDPKKPGLRGDELLEWLRAGFTELADLLDATDDDTPAWSWSAEQRVGFWRRRTALETLVHRWDAENATGATTPLDPELAADCADEMFGVMLPSGGDESTYRSPSFVALLETTDHPDAWTIHLHDGEVPTVERSRTQTADVTATGRAEDVALMLWGRLGPDVLDVHGDPAQASAFFSWLKD